MEDYERVILVKSDVFIFKIPPRTTNRAYRAADWKLDCPDWSGRLRLVAKGKECILKLEDKISGELFGKCPVDKYPGIAIESVSDSSRYFVIRLQDDNGRAAFIGIGFSDRGDSFDLNVALQDHFKVLQKEEEIEKEKKEPEDNTPKLDLGFKEGQTIKVNLNIARKGGSNSATSRQRAKPIGGGTGVLLPPPPAGIKIAGPTPVTKNTSNSVKPKETAQSNDNDFLLDLNSLNIGSSTNTNTTVNTNANVGSNNTNSHDLWSDFESTDTKTSVNVKNESDPWAQF
jgi:hypothetical protein